MGGTGVKLHAYSRHWMAVSGKESALAALPQGRKPVPME